MVEKENVKITIHIRNSVRRTPPEERQAKHSENSREHSPQVSHTGGSTGCPGMLQKALLL
jgi:hypothetical protein